MSSNTNIGNTPVNQGYVQLIHTGETGGIDGTLRTLYDGDGTASDLQIASNKVKVSTELYIGSKTATEFIQDIVGDMFTTGSYTNITTTYDDTNGNIDLNASGDVTLSNSVTLSNKTLAAPTLTGTTQGASITLSGDLTVNGTTTTVNQTNLDVSDNIIGLNRGAGSNANDSGLIIERGSTGDNAAIIWDESADKFTLGTTTSTPSATGDLTISTGTLVAALEGNADTATKIASITNSNIVQLTSSQTLSNKTLTSPIIDSVTISTIQTGSESFADNDTSLMTSAAIQDKITSYGYVTSSGISFDGSTANGVLTFKDSDEATVESTLTWSGTYLDITSNDGAEGGVRLNKSTMDGTHIRYHISHRDDNQTLIVYSYDGTTFRNWITLDEPNALLKLGSNSSALCDIDASGNFKVFSHLELPYGEINDSGTDLNIVGTNAVTLGTESGTALTIPNASTNVGIGETSPEAKLHIKNASAGTFTASNSQLLIENNTTVRLSMVSPAANGCKIEFGDINDQDVGMINYDHSNNYMAFTTNASEKMRINSSGSVLIGTSNTGWDGDADNLVVGSGSGNNGMTIYAGSSNFSQINFADSNSGAGRYTGVLRYTHSTNAMSFHTNDGAERMRINSSGNIAIGISAAKTKLDVENTTAPTLDNDTHAGEAIFIRSGGSAGDGNVQAVLAFGKADGSSRRSGSAIASVQVDSDADKVGVGFYTSDSSASSQTMDLRMLLNHTGNLHVDADVVAFSTSVSDEKLKDNVKTISNPLDKVMALRGVEFDWNKGNRKGQKDLGLIAQEVEKVLPEIVREKKMAFIDNETYKTIDYDKVVGVLIEAIKEQQQQIEELKNG